MSHVQFDGITYDPELDGERLKRQFERVLVLMSDSQWRTFQDIKSETGIESDASISARLRDMRKPRFGSYRVEKRRKAGHPGLWEYRVLSPYTIDPHGQRAFA